MPQLSLPMTTAVFHCLVSVMSFKANKSDTVQLACLRCGLLACFARCSVKDLKYMVSRQSHRFDYNSGIIAFTTGINCLLLEQLFPICTQIRVVTYTNYHIHMYMTGSDLFQAH